MSKCKGYAAAIAKSPLAPWDFQRREPREHDIVIDIKYCGICHSDIHQTRDEWSEYQDEAIFPMVPGHEIAGIVAAVGQQGNEIQGGRQGRRRMFRRLVPHLPRMQARTRAVLHRGNRVDLQRARQRRRPDLRRIFRQESWWMRTMRCACLRICRSMRALLCSAQESRCIRR